MKPPRSRLPGRSMLLLALAAIAPPTVVQAAWEMVPDVTLSVENNDNLLRTNTNEVDASRTLVDASVNFVNTTERGFLFVEPRVVSDAYSSSQNSIYESDDVFLRAGGRHRRQTSAGEFRLMYSDESTIRAEFANAVPIDPNVPPPPDIDSGLVGAALQQQRMYLYGNLDFQLSQRNQLRLETALTTVHYPGLTANAGYSDFDDTSVAVRYARTLNQRSQLTARVFGSQFDADLNDNQTDSTGVELGLSRSLTETWTANLTVGAFNADFRFVDTGTQTVQSSSESGTMFGLGFRNRSERTTLNLDLYRQLSPNSNGFLTLQDSLRAYVNRRMGPRVEGYVGALYSETSTVGGEAAIPDRNYTRVEFGLNWSVTQRLYLNFAYNSLTQSFANSNTPDTQSNTVIVGFGYRGLQRP